VARGEWRATGQSGKIAVIDSKESETSRSRISEESYEA
jgi:hypothetical protein